MSSVLLMFLSFARKWTCMERAVNVSKNLCIATDFRCPEKKEIVRICNATMDLECGLPDQGLVHKYYLACLLGAWIVDNDTEAVLNKIAWTTVAYLRLLLFEPGSYLIETGSQMSWRDKYLKLHCKERVTLVRSYRYTQGSWTINSDAVASGGWYKHF